MKGGKPKGRGQPPVCKHSISPGASLDESLGFLLMSLDTSLEGDTHYSILEGSREKVVSVLPCKYLTKSSSSIQF